MTAWLIRIGTILWGDTEFGVRIIGHSLMIGASVGMYQLGKMWWGSSAGWGAAILLQIFPFYFGTGFIATMDTPLLFFWIIGLIGISYALKYDRAWGWYVGGIGLGFSMLSKYTGIFLVPGAFLTMLFYPP